MKSIRTTVILLGVLALATPNSASCQDAPPITRRDNINESIHGVEIADPYRWLEDQNSPETRAWIGAQNRHTDSYLGGPERRARIAKRLEELIRIERISAPIARKERYFYTKQRPTDEHAILYVKDGIHGKERVFFDPIPLSPDHTMSAGFREVSRDGNLVAFWIRKGGEDESEIRIMDVRTMKELPDRLPRGNYRSFSFKRDGSGFYYVLFKSLIGSTLYYHSIGTPVAEDRRRAGPAAPERGLGVSVTPSGKYLILSVSRGSVTNEFFIYDLMGEGSPNNKIGEGLASRFDVTEAGERMAILTNWKAPNRRILLMSPTQEDPSQWKEIVPEGADAISGCSAVGGKLFVHYLHNVSSQVKIFDLNGKSLGELSLTGPGSAGPPSGFWDEDQAFYSFRSFTTPSSTYRYDVATRRSTLWSQPKVPARLNQFETKQVWYESKDGTKIPMYLVQKKGLKWDGERPVLLTAYGGFNNSMTPSFSTRAILWAEQGGVFAQPNLRGGGEFGESWHRAGMLGKKQNVFDDFFAAAEWLIAKKVTRPEKLGIEGGSNGGLLMGAAITQRPELFGAVVCSVPLLDMVRYHKFLQGPQWTPEYGSADDPEHFKFLHAYSPYHQVKPGLKYPPTLFVTGDSDTRVAPLHARKMTALLQSVVDPNIPILLHYETELGHSGGAPVSKQVEEQALVLGFLMRRLGVRMD